jgi:glycosyltransferase involved in cell wall biosynthesis
MVQAAAIDVLMTVYNGEAYVRSSIESLQNQSLADICVKVVDDGSTDATPRILAEIAAADARVQVYRKANGGIVEAANFGLAHCTAEFVARLDADDLAYPDRLERQLAYLRAQPDVLAISGAARHIGPDGERLGTKASFLSPDRADPAYIPAIEPYLLHPFLMVRREAIVRVGGYRQLSVAEDTDLYWRLQELGPLVNDQHLYGEYRMNPDSVSSRSLRGGRLMAVYSQLAAASAARRRSGRADLEFTSELTDRLKASAESLESICAAASQQLSDRERKSLRFATAVKLLEMAGYRPYEVELSDCLFLRRAFDESGASLRGANRKIVLRMLSGSAARLAAKGQWTEARALLVSRSRIPFWSRLLVRKTLTPELHRRIHGLIDPVLSLARGS